VFIVVDSKLECGVFVDTVEICKCNGLPLAVALGLYAICFYVFNLKFPQNSANCCTFLQKFAFGIKDKSQDAYVARLQEACIIVMDELRKSIGPVGVKKTVEKCKKNRRTNPSLPLSVHESIESAGSMEPCASVSAIPADPDTIPGNSVEPCTNVGAIPADLDTRDAPETLLVETRPETLSFETETRPRLWPRCPRRDRDRDTYHPRRDRDETLSRSRDSHTIETSRPRSSHWY